MNGYLLIDKPVGWTSFDVVNYIRKMIAEYEGKRPKQVKVGHSGTLDPFATGLLVILVGTYTKRQDDFMKQAKIYEAVIKLGARSSTGDPEGEITDAEVSQPPTLERVNQALEVFRGDIEQVPPIYSAIRVDGKKAYELARAGKTVEMKARHVTVHSLEVLDYNWPDLRLRAHVSSGTYIRSLANDLGEALGTGAYCNELRRTQIGELSVNEAQPVDKLSISMLKLLK